MFRSDLNETQGQLITPCNHSQHNTTNSHKSQLPSKYKQLSLIHSTTTDPSSRSQPVDPPSFPSKKKKKSTRRLHTPDSLVPSTELEPGRTQLHHLHVASPTLNQKHLKKVRWLNGRASDYESGGSRFDPWVDREKVQSQDCARFCFCFYFHPLMRYNTTFFFTTGFYRQ